MAYFIFRSLCLPEDHKDLSQVGMISVRDVNQGHFEYESDLECSDYRSRECLLTSSIYRSFERLSADNHNLEPRI